MSVKNIKFGLKDICLNAGIIVMKSQENLFTWFNCKMVLLVHFYKLINTHNKEHISAGDTAAEHHL